MYIYIYIYTHRERERLIDIDTWKTGSSQIVPNRKTRVISLPESLPETRVISLPEYAGSR